MAGGNGKRNSALFTHDTRQLDAFDDSEMISGGLQMQGKN
jgi:hypothetical protein